MKIQILKLGDYWTNCYLIMDEDSGKCGIIDPADDGERIAANIKAMGAQPEAILLTHGHYDHILGITQLHKHWPGLCVYCHKLDCPDQLTEVDMGVTYPTVSAFSNLSYLRDGQRLFIGAIRIEVMHTPGHTPGSVTFIAGEVLFTGDTLFQGDIGRSDFEGGDENTLMESLQRIKALPGNYRVLPGHEGETTLEAERRTNPYLRY